MDVLVISNFYPPEVLGGYELSCAHVVEGMRRRGHRVTVLTTGLPEIGQAARPYVKRSLYLSDLYRLVGGDRAHRRAVEHAGRVSFYFNVWQVLQALESLKPDIVYAFNLLGLGVMNLVDTLNRSGVPWVWHIGDAIPKEACRDVSVAVRNQFACGGGDFSGGAIIAVSECVHGEVTAAGINLGERINYIPYWGIVGDIPRDDRPPADDGRIRFVNSGTMGVHKGTDLIVEAAGLLIERGHTAFKIDLIGPGETADFAARAERLCVSTHLRFLGPKSQAELYALYSDYDCFLFPTWYREPFGMAPVEAAGMGCPPIMTYGCGAAEWFVHEVHCLKIRREAPALADAMERMIDDPGLRSTLSRRARELAKSSLDFEHALNRIEQVLKSELRTTAWQEIDWGQLCRGAYEKDRAALRLCLDDV